MTGPALLRAIVADERDPARRAEVRHPGCTARVQPISKALIGPWPAAQFCIGEQARACFAPASARIAAWDQALARMRMVREARGVPPALLPALPAAKRRSNTKNAPAARPRAAVARIGGGALGGACRGAWLRPSSRSCPRWRPPCAAARA